MATSTLDITVHEGIKCPFCPVISAKRLDMNKHISSAHAIKCQLCQATFYTTKDMDKHKPIHENTDNRNSSSKFKKDPQCSICLRVVKHNYLKTHLTKNHKFECKFCTLRFLLSADLREHMTHVHPNESQLKIKCPLCPGLFETVLNLKKHFDTGHKTIHVNVKKNFDTTDHSVHEETKLQ